jgi:hypothetical protein
MTSYPDGSLPRDVAQIMKNATNDDCGTVAALASLSCELEEQHEDGKYHICICQLPDFSFDDPANKAYVLSPRCKTAVMSSDTYRILLSHLRTNHPHLRVHSLSGQLRQPGSIPLNDHATFYDYAIIRGQRYQAYNTVGILSTALVEVSLPSHCENATENARNIHCGELLEIFHFMQSGSSFYFGRMRWFKPWDGDKDDVWQK